MVWEDQRKALNEAPLSTALKDELELSKKGGAGESRVGYVSSRGIFARRRRDNQYNWNLAMLKGLAGDMRRFLSLS